MHRFSIFFIYFYMLTAFHCVCSYVHRGSSRYDRTQRSGRGDGLLFQRGRDTLIFTGDTVVVHQEPCGLDGQTALDNQWSRSITGKQYKIIQCLIHDTLSHNLLLIWYPQTPRHLRFRSYLFGYTLFLTQALHITARSVTRGVPQGSVLAHSYSLSTSYPLVILSGNMAQLYLATKPTHFPFQLLTWNNNLVLIQVSQQW